MDQDVRTEGLVKLGTSDQDQGVENDLDKQNVKPSNEVINKIDKDYKDPVKAKLYDFGFLHSKFIKNVFCCLKENQQIGKIMPLHYFCR